MKAAKSIGPCPSYYRADCPGTQRPEGAAPRPRPVYGPTADAHPAAAERGHQTPARRALRLTNSPAAMPWAYPPFAAPPAPRKPKETEGSPIFTRALDTIRTGFIRNPIAWILVVLLCMAEYGNYQRGRELDRVCELLGSHDVAVMSPQTPNEEIDDICKTQRQNARTVFSTCKGMALDIFAETIRVLSLRLLMKNKDPSKNPVCRGIKPACPPKFAPLLPWGWPSYLTPCLFRLSQCTIAGRRYEFAVPASA